VSKSVNEIHATVRAELGLNLLDACKHVFVLGFRGSSGASAMGEDDEPYRCIDFIRHQHGWLETDRPAIRRNDLLHE
jgi:hypothetical protein